MPPELLVQLRVGGLGVVSVSTLGVELLFGVKLLREGRCWLGGVFLRRNAAPGHPHSYSSAGEFPGPRDEYAGRDVLACVARHDRMLKGESMDISKCRRLFGSFSSGRESRITI
jgi:hypothetical protein